MTSGLLIRCLFGVVGVLVIAPMALFCLWPHVVRASFVGGPDTVEGAAPRAAHSLIAELIRLGFQALGVKVEKSPLRPAVRELSFVAADRQCYASIGLASLGSRLYYFTPLPDGGFALTSNGAFPKIRSANVLQRSYPRCGPEELLGHHLRALAELGRRGEVAPTSDARLEATYAYYRTFEVRKILRRTGIMLLAWVGVLGWLILR
jgi:hypothetical protein